MRIRKLAPLLTGAAIAVSATMVAGAAPAGAAGPCGSSYTRVGVYAIHHKVDGSRRAPSR
ncbi:hypothetical protein [Nonomuraea sp. B5E05]|uniref:hypothetical protein n=1 Tax=Nonomuraea sp. B5E05 TaxID=3153569 RepID=UPI003260236E